MLCYVLRVAVAKGRGMAFNFELKMLIAPLGLWGSLKWERDQHQSHRRGSKQSLMKEDRRGDSGVLVGMDQGPVDTGVVTQPPIKEY